MTAIPFGSGLGRITNIQTGPEGFVHILWFSEAQSAEKPDVD